MMDRADIRKPPFTREEMLEELKEILFVQASHIAVSLSAEAADAFIGFEVGVDWHAATVDRYRELIDLRRFNITSLLECAYDFAFQVGAYWKYGPAEGYDIEAFERGICDASYEGSHNPYKLDDSKVRHVIRLAVAREYLDIHKDALRIDQLCLLADMSEASVRNSLSKEGIRTSGKPVRVDNDEARAWLAGRRGFIPTRMKEMEKRSATESREYLLSLHPAYESARRIIAETDLQPEHIAEAAEIAFERLTAFLEGTVVETDIRFLKAVGGALGFDVPTFVGKAIQDALRRGA